MKLGEDSDEDKNVRLTANNTQGLSPGSHWPVSVLQFIASFWSAYVSPSCLHRDKEKALGKGSAEIQRHHSGILHDPQVIPQHQLWPICQPAAVMHASRAGHVLPSVATLLLGQSLRRHHRTLTKEQELKSEKFSFERKQILLKTCFVLFFFNSKCQMFLNWRSNGVHGAYSTDQWEL